MTSIIVYLALFFCISLGYALFQYKNGIGALGRWYISVIIIMTRVFPFMMIEDKNIFTAGRILAETGILVAVLFFIDSIIENKPVKRLYKMFFILNPVMVISFLTGNLYLIIGSVIVNGFMLFNIFSNRKNYGKKNCLTLIYSFAGMVTGAYGVIVNKFCFYGNIENIFNSSKDVPTILISSIFIFIISCVYCIFHAFSKTETEPVDENCNNLSVPVTKDRKIEIKDIVIIIALMIVFFIAGGFRLGSKDIPSTVYKMDSNNREIVLDLGKNKNVKEIMVFLNYKSNQRLSFSAEAGGSWDIYESKTQLKSPFQWNKITVNKNTRYLGIVCMDSWEWINEIVVIGDDGQVITPVNTSAYKELFDEQNLYPDVRSYYYQTMFDEVYHARTAYEFIEGYPIYENTHPPLGKLIIGIGIRTFGMNPFGWRIMSLIAGTICIPYIYIFGLKITGRRLGGVLAGVLVSTEFMHCVLSRIATLDIFVALFIIMLFYFMYRYIQCSEENKNCAKQYIFILLSGISTGIGIATKWTAFYGAAGICVIFFITFFKRYNSKKAFLDNKGDVVKIILCCVVSFILIPATIYVVSYYPFMKVYGGSLIENAINNSKLMLSYHSVTVFEHPYSSEWYQWIWDKQSLLDALAITAEGKVSSVATIGSPLVVWGGMAAFIYTGYLWVCKKDRNAGFLVIMYLANLLPWLLVHRTVFIYHYYPCILTLILLIAYSVIKLTGSKKRFAITVMVISVALFIIYYPEMTGLAVNRHYIDNVLELVKSWRFV